MTLYDFIYYVFYCVKPELIWCWLMLWCICMLWFRLRNLQSRPKLSPIFQYLSGLALTRQQDGAWDVMLPHCEPWSEGVGRVGLPRVHTIWSWRVVHRMSFWRRTSSFSRNTFRLEPAERRWQKIFVALPWLTLHVSLFCWPAEVALHSTQM